MYHKQCNYTSNFSSSIPYTSCSIRHSCSGCLTTCSCCSSCCVGQLGGRGPVRLEGALAGRQTSLGLLFRKQVNNQKRLNKTSAPIGTWKCEITPFYEIMTDQPTNKPSNRQTGKSGLTEVLHNK